MQEIQNLNTPYTHRVRNENIKQILFDIDAKDSSGNVTSISNLTKSTIDLVLRSDLNSNLSTTIFSGNLLDLVTAMFCQTTMYQVTLTQRNDGYKVAIIFDDYPIITDDSTYLEIRSNFSQDSFSNAVLAQSSISVETIPSELPNYHNLIPQIDSYFINNGSDRFDENIGSDIVGVIAVIDHDMDYEMTAFSKIQSVELTAFGGYNKSVSENVLLAENLQMLGQVEQYVNLRNLVLYRNTNALLDDARLKIAYKAPTSVHQKVLVIRLVQPFS